MAVHYISTSICELKTTGKRRWILEVNRGEYCSTRANAARRISTFRCFEEQDLVHAFNGQREWNDRVFSRDLMLITQLAEDHVAGFTEEQFFVGVRAAFRNDVTS